MDLDVDKLLGRLVSLGVKHLYHIALILYSMAILRDRSGLLLGLLFLYFIDMLSTNVALTWIMRISRLRGLHLRFSDVWVVPSSS